MRSFLESSSDMIHYLQTGILLCDKSWFNYCSNNGVTEQIPKWNNERVLNKYVFATIWPQSGFSQDINKINYLKSYCIGPNAKASLGYRKFGSNESQI